MPHLIKSRRYDPRNLRIRNRQADNTGFGLDVLTMPDGHLGCSECHKPFFEIWVNPISHLVEVGCFSCGWSTKLILPMTALASANGLGGKFECSKHKSGMVIIKNTDILCFGCRYCEHEVRLLVRNDNLIQLVQ